MPPVRRSALLFPSLACALAGAAFAQTPATPPTKPSSATPPDHGEVVTLEQFSVSTNAGDDYLAESISGTRIVSRQRDLPFNVNVVTRDFIDDFAAYELRDQFATVSAFSASEVPGEYQLRGFASTHFLRNGFRRPGLVDKVSIERAEVIKGPAASIYGRIQPGGVINLLTRKPRTKPQQSFGFAAGSDAFWRAQASATGPLAQSRTVFFRQDLAATGREFAQSFKEREQWTTATQLLWKPSPRTRVNFEVEYLRRRERPGNGVPTRLALDVPDPFRLPGEHHTYHRWEELAEPLADFNHQGPGEFHHHDVFTLTGTIEHRINRHWSARVGANWLDRSSQRMSVAGDAYRPDLHAIVNGADATPGPRIPVWRPTDEQAASLQADLLGSFTTGPLDHRFLFSVDYAHTREKAYEVRMSADAASLPGNSTPRLSIARPDYRFVSFVADRTLYTDERENLRSRVDNWGFFVSERVAFFAGRVVALAGLRVDTVANDVADHVVHQQREYRRNDTTHQFGLNVRVAPQITLFANTSTTFVPHARFNLDGTPLPNETGRGVEGGLKIVAFRERLAINATYFDITRHNLAREERDATSGERVVVLSGEEKAQGVELDANAQLTRSLQFLAGYGYADAAITANEDFPFLVHTTPRRVPRHTFGSALRFEFQDGPLRGVYLTFGTHHVSSSLANPGTGRLLTASPENPIVNHPMPNGLLPFPHHPPGAIVMSGRTRVGDGREALRNAGYQLYNASVGYRWRSHDRKYHHKLQLNAKNLTDQFYTWGSAIPGDPFSLIGSYSVTF